MHSSLLRLLAVAGLVLATVSSVVAAEPAMIAKARARVGAEAVLDAVQTLHYVGTISFADPQDPSKQRVSAVEIHLQKPDRQRIEITTEQAIETKVLDGYDAWSRLTNRADRQWRQSILGVDQIRQLRADVWQNLYFFRGIEAVGGEVVDRGPVTIDGVACRKLSFVHSPTLTYDRFFDEATGRLVYTGTDANNIREHGEIVAGGIRFPKSIVITLALPDGKTTAQTITFEKITVNETFAPDVFALPSLLAQ